MTSTMHAATAASVAVMIRPEASDCGTLTFGTLISRTSAVGNDALGAVALVGSADVQMPTATGGVETSSAKQAHRGLGYVPAAANDAWAPAPRETLTT